MSFFKDLARLNVLNRDHYERLVCVQLFLIKPFCFFALPFSEVLVSRLCTPQLNLCHYLPGPTRDIIHDILAQIMRQCAGLKVAGSLLQVVGHSFVVCCHKYGPTNKCDCVLILFPDWMWVHLLTFSSIVTWVPVVIRRHGPCLRLPGAHFTTEAMKTKSPFSLESLFYFGLYP